MKKLFFLLLLFCNASYAQEYSFKTYNTTNGLSNNVTTAISKDKKGFIWIGTQNGLNRFDGNSFDNFYNNPNDTTTILDNYVFSLFVTKKNKLWVGTATGINMFDDKKQQFVSYTPDTFVMPKISELFTCINEDDKENIWVGAKYDLLIFNPISKKFSSSGWAKYALQVRPQNGNHRRIAILSIEKKSSTEFWVLTTYGLFSVNTTSLIFTYYPYSLVSDYYGSSLNYIDDENNLWINTYSNGLLKYNVATQSWKSYSIPNTYTSIIGWNNVNHVSLYSKDTLLVCSNNVLLLFDIVNENFLKSILNTNDVQNIPSNTNFSKAFKHSNFFLVLTNNGYIQMSQKKSLVNFIPVENLSMVNKLFFSSSTNSLVIGDFYTKSIFFNKENKSYTLVKTNPLANENGVRAYTEVNKNTAYLSTDENIYLINPTTTEAKEILLPSKKFKDNPNTVRNVVVDKDGMVWMRLRSQGIYKYNPKTQQGQYTNFIPYSESNEYSYIYYDSMANAIIVAVANQGVYIHNITSGTTQKYLLNISPSQKGANITCITGNNKGDVFLADHSYGLFVYNFTANSFKRYTTADGLVSNNCNWVITDAQKKIWIATNDGISCFDNNKKQFINFSKEEGNPLFADFLATDTSGNIYQPWKNGFFFWKSNSIQQPKQVGTIYLRNCYINEKASALDSVYTLSASQNNISFQFGYLLFNNNNPLAFEYSLNKSNWLSIGNDNKISFSNLSPNTYFLQVREKNNPQNIFTITAIIKPPFYKTWWFLSALLVAGAASIYFIVKARVDEIKKQAQLKQKIVETEMMALRAQMNPHFIFNCISSIDNFILDNDANNASSYLNKFAKLIRNILDSSKNETISFWKDRETIELYLQLEQLRSNNSFIYAFDVDENLTNGHYKIPPLIIQPYIENAIHHGLKPLQNKIGQLKITAQLNNGVLKYTIADNGVGRTNAAKNKMLKNQHQSYGMQLTQQRINLFNKQKSNIIIQDIDVDGNTGTIVTVFLNV